MKLTLSLLGGVLFLCQTADSETGPYKVEELTCSFEKEHSPITDYRARFSTDFLKFSIADNNKYHLEPANRRMRQGDFSSPVIADLHFILIRWPNHYPALQALVAFEAGGGRANRYKPLECYFHFARRYFSDDANISILLGLYHYRKGEYERAENAWQVALQVDPDSAEAHYNLGLLSVRQSRYPDAVPHARAAYDAGYPLSGLKTKLTDAGYWSE